MMSPALFLAAAFLPPDTLLRIRSESSADSIAIAAETRARGDGPDAPSPFATIRLRGAPKPFLYPIFGPSGTSMTRGYPMDPRPDEERDHPHQRSMWFAHGDVNGVDFWSEGEGRGRIEVDRAEVPESDTETRVKVVLFCTWRDADGKALLREERRLWFAAAERDRVIDHESVLIADQGTDVRFGDTKEGTMALRLAKELRLEGPVARGRAFNSEGVTGKAVWGKRARFVHYEGEIQGRTVGVTVFDHPDNPRHPTHWHARPYGLLAANPFGLHHFEGRPRGAGDFTVKAGETVRFRYRVVFHDGARTLDELLERFEDLAASFCEGERGSSGAHRRDDRPDDGGPR